MNESGRRPLLIDNSRLWKLEFEYDVLISALLDSYNFEDPFGRSSIFF